MTEAENISDCELPKDILYWALMGNLRGILRENGPYHNDTALTQVRL